MEVLAKDGFSYFVGKIKPTLSHSLMSGITTTAGSASSPYLSVKWSVANVDGITTPYNGMRIAVKIPMVGVGTAGVILSIDGGTTWHPVAYNINTVLTSHYPLNSVKYLTYDANQSMTGYITAGTATSITGVWKGDADYDSVNLYQDYLYYAGAKSGSNGIMRNSLVMRKSDDTYESFTTTNGTGTAKTINTSGFYPGELYYYAGASNVAANTNIGNTSLYPLYTSLLDARYSFNCGTTLTGYKAFYVVGKIQDGLFYLQSPYWSTSLPATEDGKVYMLIGRTYDTYRHTLFGYHPMFEYKNGSLREYCPVGSVPTETDSAVTGISISNHSSTSIYGVGSSTTSVYGVKSGTGSTTTASKASGGNGTAPTLGTAFTIPNVTNKGSASSWTFEEKTIPNVTAAGSASSWTFEEKTIPNVTSAGSASSWTFEEKTIPNVTAAGSGSFTSGAFNGGSGSFSATVTNHVLSFSHTHTAATHGADSHTHTAPTLGTAIKVQSKSGGSNGTAPTLGTAIKVQSKSGGSNGTAPTLGTAIKVQSKSGGSNGSAPTLGTAFTVPNVTSAGSASTWSFTDVTVPIRADSATTVPIKNSSATTVVTSATHSITDNGHTHDLS